MQTENTPHRKAHTMPSVLSTANFCLFEAIRHEDRGDLDTAYRYAENAAWMMENSEPAFGEEDDWEWMADVLRATIARINWYRYNGAAV